MRKELLLALLLQIAMVETTVAVDPGTVYSVVTVVAAGALCAKTLYAVGIFYPYIPANINGLIVSVAVPPLDVDVDVDAAPSPEMLTHCTPVVDAILLKRTPVAGLYHSSPTVTAVGSVVETKCCSVTRVDMIYACASVQLIRARIELVVTPVTLVAVIVIISGPSGYKLLKVVGQRLLVPPPRILVPKSRT